MGGEVSAAPDPSTALLYASCERGEEGGGGGGTRSFSFLNSGSIMGLAKHLRTMVREVIADMEEHHARCAPIPALPVHDARLAWPRLAWPRLAWPRLAWPRLAWPRLASPAPAPPGGNCFGDSFCTTLGRP